MHGFMYEELDGLLSTEESVRDNRYSTDRSMYGCRPLWLTPREAEALLVLCAASPVSVGPGEQDLFIKLGDFFRTCSR